MGIALTLQEYLDDHHVPYDVMLHKRTHCAFDTARATHVPGERVAKAVVLTREGGFVIAVVPATARVRLDVIERMLHCPVDLADFCCQVVERLMNRVVEHGPRSGRVTALCLHRCFAETRPRRQVRVIDTRSASGHNEEHEPGGQQGGAGQPTVRCHVSPLFSL